MKSLAASAVLTICAFAANALTVAPGAALYVANGNANTVEAITPAGVGSLFVTNGLSDPFGLAFDSIGNLYISSFNGTTVEKVTPNGVASVFASGFSAPSGLAFDGAGNLYVANFNGNTINKISPAGVVTVFASSGLDNPTGIAFDSAGNLYVCNWGNNTIEKFDSSGNGSLFAGSELSNPSGIAFDGAGNIYVANYGSTYITEFTPGGVPSIFATGLSAPSGLAFDSAGNLYVANYANNTIDEITPGGVASVFVSSGLNIPLMLAFAPPPGVLPQLQSVQSDVAGLSVTKPLDKLAIGIANAAMKVAVQPANWLNNYQPTVKGGDVVFAGILVAEIELEVVLADNRSNATLSNEIEPLIEQLTDAAQDIATTAVTNNPTAKYIKQANGFLAAGNAATDPGVAIVDYSLAWDLIY